MFLKLFYLKWAFYLMLIHFTVVHFIEAFITPEKIQDNVGDGENFDFRTNDEESIRLHYALDPRRTEKLALLEEQLASTLYSVLEDMPSSMNNDPCYIYISKYLWEFNQDIKAVHGENGTVRAKMVTDNPNLILKMIRRITVTFRSDIMNSCRDSFSVVESAIKSLLEGAMLSPPSQQDLDDALLGLLRIQYIYGLNATSQLRLGNLNGVYTGAFLYFDDCLALGKKAIDMGAEVMAYQWLVSARLSPPEVNSPQEQVNKDMQDLSNNWLKLMNLTKIWSFEDLHEKLQNKRQLTLKGHNNYYSYVTCRGENRQRIELQSRLVCFYQTYWDPYFYINPVKTEMLSEDPVIYQFYDFVGDETIESIWNSKMTRMTRSGVLSPTHPRTEFMPLRTSLNAWIFDSEEYETHPKLVTLNRKTEKLTGLKIIKKGASHALQVGLYGSLGGYYDFHFDAMQTSPAATLGNGDRIATLLFFLSDVKMGGYTAFKFVGTFAKPVKGSALLWFNLRPDGKMDTRTMHAGCPVILGTKEIANRWILEYENMWNYPCFLEMNV